jgi:ubiquinone/menaquinone biosynthesis C-methylase UbiE
MTSHHDHSAEPVADLVELEADLIRTAFIEPVVTWLSGLVDGTPQDPLLDLGSGPGVWAIALAKGFPAATVTAVDISATMLDRLRARASQAGVMDRVTVVEADLDIDPIPTGPFALAVMSNALHHMKDPDRVLTELATRLRPGGLLAIAEMTSPPSFLPNVLGIGNPGLEARLVAAVGTEHAPALPDLYREWSDPLTRAGFTVEAARPFDLQATEEIGPFAALWLRRMVNSAHHHLDAADEAALTTLLGEGPDGVLDRTDLVYRSPRPVWLARR